MKWREFLLQSRVVRLAALSRKKNGALGQLGWFDQDFERLLVSGPSPSPWFPYGAVDFLECWVPPEATVLELGGGASTKFWVDRGNTVTTVESDPVWAEVIERNIPGGKSHQLFVEREIGPRSLEALHLGEFDVIINDFNGGEGRHSVGAWLLEHISPAGLIVWDNSDRESYAPGLRILREAGLGEVSFFGLGPVNAYASETTIFSKSFPRRSWELRHRKTVRY
jgi:precorrin-6B methylase 2